MEGEEGGARFKRFLVAVSVLRTSSLFVRRYNTFSPTFFFFFALGGIQRRRKDASFEFSRKVSKF